jgi:hypothetical protein
MAKGGQAQAQQQYGVNPYQQASQGMQQAYNTAGNVGTIAQGMGAYQNPYQQQVIDRTAADMNRNLGMQQQATKAAAINSGAFGGGRHGLVEAENMAQTNRAIGDMSAQMNQQGFNTAGQFAGQDIANRYNQAGMLGNLAGQSFGMGNTINQNQLASGTLGQQLNQQLLDQSSGMFGAYSGTPAQQLQMRLAALGMSPLSGNTTGTATQTTQPGMGEIFGNLLGAAGSIVGMNPFGLFK